MNNFHCLITYFSVDIYSRAKKLCIENNAPRGEFLIETETDKESNVVSIARSIFPTKQKDFATAVDEKGDYSRKGT